MSDKTFCLMCNTGRMAIIAGAFIFGAHYKWWGPGTFWVPLLMYLWLRAECSGPEVYEDE